MKYLLAIIISLLTFTVFGQSKDIVLKTRKYFLKEKDFILTQGINDLLIDKTFSSDKILFGNMHIDYYTEDSLLIKIYGKMPILIIGFQNLDTSDLIITKLPLTDYTPIDTFHLETTKLDKYGKADKTSITTEISTPYNSDKFEYTQEQLIINGNTYISKLISRPHVSSGVYCIPGKVSHKQFFKGIEKIYVFEIKTNANKG